MARVEALEVVADGEPAGALEGRDLPPRVQELALLHVVGRPQVRELRGDRALAARKRGLEKANYLSFFRGAPLRGV